MSRDGREWTVKHLGWVRKQKFDDRCQQCVHDDYVQADISWEAQQSLCRRLTHFTENNKPRHKAIVALAWELAGFIWSLGQVPQLLA